MITPTLENIPEDNELKLSMPAYRDNDFTDFDADIEPIEDASPLSYLGVAYEERVPNVSTDDPTQRQCSFTSSSSTTTSAKLTSSLAPKPTECEDRPAFTIFIDPITSDGKDSKFRAAGKLQGDSIANKPQRHFKLFNLTASKKIAKENRVSDSAIRDESSSAVTKGRDGIAVAKGPLQLSQTLQSLLSEAQ